MAIKKRPDYIDKVFFADSRNMGELPDESVHLVVTSPPYFNIKDYSLDGYQEFVHSERAYGQIGDIEEHGYPLDSTSPYM